MRYDKKRDKKKIWLEKSAVRKKLSKAVLNGSVMAVLVEGEVLTGRG